MMCVQDVEGERQISIYPPHPALSRAIALAGKRLQSNPPLAFDGPCTGSPPDRSERILLECASLVVPRWAITA